MRNWFGLRFLVGGGLLTFEALTAKHAVNEVDYPQTHLSSRERISLGSSGSAVMQSKTRTTSPKSSAL
jgi:hypothetical protein